MNDFVLKGNLCSSRSAAALDITENGYLVCEGGDVSGVYPKLPERYAGLPVLDYGNAIIIPGLVDLHTHAPQFSFRGLGMDMELLDWLNTHTFPEEAKYADTDYAAAAYRAFTDDLVRGASTRACIFATVHVTATLILMDMLETSGIAAMVGKVSMDRNGPLELIEESAERSARDTMAWLQASEKYSLVSPILTPRFIPSCSDALLSRLGLIQQRTGLPVQSHLSENTGEIAWVRELHPQSDSYGDAYSRFGLFGGNARTVMAHCVWPTDGELDLIRDNGVWIAHCPQSNTNLASGIAPVRRLLNAEIRVGLGSDIAGGCHTSIFRAMSDAIQVSKLRRQLVDEADKPLTVPEVFYMGTAGGGSFFGKVGRFDPGYELDAVVIDDSPLSAPFALSVEERLTRIIYLSDDRHIIAKFVKGRKIFDASVSRGGL